MKLGTHCTVLSEVTTESGTPMVAGTKAFIAALEPLTVATKDGARARVEAAQVRLGKGRPVKLA